MVNFFVMPIRTIPPGGNSPFYYITEYRIYVERPDISGLHNVQIPSTWSPSDALDENDSNNGELLSRKRRSACVPASRRRTGEYILI